MKAVAAVTILVSLGLFFTWPAISRSDDTAVAVTECGEVSRALFTSDRERIGTVVVERRATGGLCVRFSVDDADWRLLEAQVAVADTPANLPQSSIGQPAPEQFPYTLASHSERAGELCVEVAGDTALAIAAHVMAAPVAHEDRPGEQRSAWADGAAFAGAPAATYLVMHSNGCVGADAKATCGYRTYDQDQWGGLCDDSGDNEIACYRNENFYSVFGRGFSLGCQAGESTIVSTWQAVQSHLPSAGEPRALTEAEVRRRYLDGYADATGLLLYDPTMETELFGNTAALALNLGFDGHGGFKPQATKYDLAALQVAEPTSPCSGMTVRQIFEEANSILGGCGSVLEPEQINQCVAAVNAAFQSESGVTSCTTYLSAADAM